MRKVILNMIADEKRGAVLENNKVVEWLYEQEDNVTRSGNIFLGKVIDIVPGMEAAFVDIGSEKNGFLYRNDLLAFQPFKDDPTKKDSYPSIRSILTKGQSIIVQITKEAVGTKGVRLTEVCSLPGKYLVYLPKAGYVAVSKKMKDESSRDKWRDKGKSWLQDEEGLILRTVSETVDEQTVNNELQRLRNQYKEIESVAKGIKPPSLLYNQSSLLDRVVRDYMADGETEVIVDTLEDYKKLTAWMEMERSKQIHFHNSTEEIFSTYDLNKQLDKSVRSHVWLKNGGFLIIEKTEALTVIDINTGKYVGKENLRETVLKTNIEAANTVAEHLRLRNISGIILIDFIDMKFDEDREKVLEALKFAASHDRTLTNIGGFTKFGLVEMTRKKTRNSLESILFEDCTVCQGSGKVQSVHSAYSSLVRDVFTLRFTEADAFLLEVSPLLMDELMKNNKEKLIELENKMKKKLFCMKFPQLSVAVTSHHFLRLMGSVDEIHGIWEARSKQRVDK
ncbi:Rne/Rng family ribonuclease [Evansella sp. AB-rgal1]|uniref:Rne/Rng family ribonuclease n=1 Tax=Evansella sp. AB-rgal1 TaxID=3242696 RepID=UPI00359E4EE8